VAEERRRLPSMVPTVPRWLPPPALQPTVPDWAAGEESAEVQVVPQPELDLTSEVSSQDYLRSAEPMPSGFLHQRYIIITKYCIHDRFYDRHHTVHASLIQFSNIFDRKLNLNPGP